MKWKTIVAPTMMAAMPVFMSPAASAAPCQVISTSELTNRVDAIIAKKDKVDSISLASDLMFYWRNTCSSEKKRSENVIQIGRLLNIPSLHLYVAVMVNEIWPDADVVREKIHLAYVDRVRYFGNTKSMVVAGDGKSSLYYLKCLNDRVYKKISALKTCGALDRKTKEVADAELEGQ